MEDRIRLKETEGLLDVWRTRGPDVNLATQICCELKSSQRFAELAKFVEKLPETQDYQKEEFIRFKIDVAWMSRNCQLVYKLIEGNSFVNGEDLIEIWDKAHYYEEAKIKGKVLTALAKFRVRQKYTPPRSICPSGVRKKFTLPKEATQVLRNWLRANTDHPYPPKEVKFALISQSGLTHKQVDTWLANARRRRHKNKPRKFLGSVKQLSTTQSHKKLANIFFPTRILGQPIGFPISSPCMFAFEQAPSQPVNQSLFPFPQQYLVPGAPMCWSFPLTNLNKPEESFIQGGQATHHGNPTAHLSNFTSPQPVLTSVFHPSTSLPFVTQPGVQASHPWMHSYGIDWHLRDVCY